MANYKLTVKAVKDLTQIWNYTFEEWSENQADIYYNLLINTFNEIAEKPHLGKDYSIIAGNLLGFKTGKHIIFYIRTSSDTIEIIRILHENMDIKNRIKDK